MNIQRGRTDNPGSNSNGVGVTPPDADEELAKDKDRMDPNAVRKIVHSGSLQLGNSDEEVFLWISQPVLGFVAEPHFTCRSKSGETLSDPFSRYRFTWYRSRKYYLCNSDNCINMKQQNSNPSEVKYQCMTCLQYGNERRSYFCCPECMKRGWKTHCLTHKITPSSTVKSEVKMPIGDDMTVEHLADLQLKQAKTHKSPMEGWDKISVDTTYHPTENDVGHKLKIEVSSLFTNSSVMTIESLPVIEPPSYVPPRQWTTTQKVKVAPTMPSLTITSYNMLADIYCRPELYTQCPLWALEWSYRRDRLFKQVEARNSDIFCLQEIEKKEYELFWKPRMEEKHYAGFFTVKTRVLFGSDERVDGCATFYKQDLFDFNGQLQISFNSLADALLADGSITPKQYSRLKRGNVAHIIRMTYFYNNMQSIPFYLCNCHLFWDPKYSDVKLIQSYQLITQIQALMQQEPLPLIICGDFNSEPHSAVYEFLSTGRVMPTNRDVVNDPENLIAAIGVQNIFHNLRLCSCYADVRGKEPDFTNYTDHYVGCLDYIWVTPSFITPIKVSNLPTVEEIESFGKLKLPNPKYVSDHLALDCTMAFDTMRSLRF